MRVARFAYKDKIKFGILEDKLIRSFPGSPFSSGGASFKFDGDTYALDDVKLLTPCLPSKIVAVGLNYRSHVEEAKMPMPTVPLIFLKPSTSVIGPCNEIVLPRKSKRVDYEGELGVVIGSKAKDIPQDKAGDYIFGYTCVNDVSERYNQKEDGQWTRAKGYDSFAPIGPWIETAILPDDLKLETYLNGELRQSARTSDLIFSAFELVSFISEVMTLLPGDVIATGTTSGIGPMNSGDIVEVKIEKIGTLKNSVVMQS
ncbi:MAG: fumarylacetoacetate hydrolase family protein [Dehalococcoidia bacterium]|nr:fumarylacetoacetate hydrolase family protein [Dehalococcoidia bacterium]